MKVTKYVIEVVRVKEDFYTGVKETVWIRKKDTFATKEEAIEKAKKCRNDWVVIEVTIDIDTMQTKQKVVADQMHY